MKNSRDFTSGNTGFKKTVLTTGLLTALSGAAYADENKTISVSTPQEVTAQVQSDVHSISRLLNKEVYYDASTNTIVVQEKRTPPEIRELQIIPSLEQSNNTVEIQAAESLFGIDLTIFNSLYAGNLNALNESAEVLTLIKERDILVEKRNKMNTEDEMKSIDAELMNISARITNAKNIASLKYFEKIWEKLKALFPTYEQKIWYIGGLNTENEQLRNLIAFSKAILIEGVTSPSIETPIYTDVNYLTEEQSSNFNKRISSTEGEKYSEEQKTSFKNRFIKLSDVRNVVALSEYVNESNVFDYLADLNHDGIVSDNDTGVFYGKQLSVLFREIESQMKIEGKEAQFYSNLSYIFAFGGVKTSLLNKASLVEFLQKNPTAKFQFNDAFYRLNISGADIGYVLKFGVEWLAKWESAKGKIFTNSLTGKLFTKIQDGTKNLKNEITRLKNEGIISDQEYFQVLNTLEKTINNPRWEEQVMTQALTLLSSVSAMYFSSNNGGLQASYSNSATNLQLSQITKQFIDSVELSTGVYNSADGNMLMLGLTYKGIKKVSETEALTFNTGVNFGIGDTSNVLPVIGLGYIKNTNAEEIKQAGIVDFDLDDKNFKVGASLSMINTKGIMLGFGFKFSTDKKTAIEKKVREYSKLLDIVFACNTNQKLENCMQYIQSKITSEWYEKVTFLGDSLVDTEARLQMQGFNNLTPQGRQRILEEEKMFYITKFLNSQASNEAEKGWGVSGWGLGLSLLANAVTGGIPIIPGVEISKTSMKYTPHQTKKSMTEIIQQEGIGETIILSKDDQKLGENLTRILNIKWLVVSYVNGYLTITSPGEEMRDFLIKNGVDLRVGISKKVISHIALNQNTLTIGDVGQIAYFNAITAEGKRITLVIGDKWSKGTGSFTQELTEVLKKNQKEVFSKDVNFTYTTITEQQVGDIFTKKFGLGIF